MSRRGIQPPGGTSSIFFGEEESAKKAPQPTRGEEQKPDQGQKGAEQGHIRKQTDESPESSFGQIQGTVPERAAQPAQQTEASRNKDRQKSSIVFGDDPVKEPGAKNKAQGPGEHDSAAPDNKPKEKPAPEAENGKDGTSIKIHHPPGGKSSGPLW